MDELTTKEYEAKTDDINILQLKVLQAILKELQILNSK